MFAKLKEKILDTSHDDLLHSIQNSSLIVMMVCVLTFFLTKKLIPKFLIIHIAVFTVASIITLVIGILWFLKEFIPYRDAMLKQFYLDNPDLAPKAKKEGAKDEKENNRPED